MSLCTYLCVFFYIVITTLPWMGEREGREKGGKEGGNKWELELHIF